MRRMRQNGSTRQMYKRRTVCDYKNISVRICGTGASVYPSCGQMAEQQNNAKKSSACGVYPWAVFVWESEE